MNAAIDFLHRKRASPFLLVVSFINPHDICLLAGEASPILDDVWRKYQPPADAELPPLPPNFNIPAGEADRAALRKRHAAWDEHRWREYLYA